MVVAELGRALGWLLATLVVYVLAVVVAFPFGTLIEGVAAGGSPARLGGAAAVWAVVASGLAAWLGHLVLAAPRVDARALLAVIASTAIAAGTAEWGVVVWAELRFGMFDPEYVGLSNLLAPAIVGIGVAAAGWLSTRGNARRAATGLGSFFVVLFSAVAMSNLRGVSDGLSQGAWALGLGIAVPGAFVIVLLGMLLRRAVRQRRLGSCGTICW